MTAKTSEFQRGYSNGYAAGRKKSVEDMKEIHKFQVLASEQRERIYMKCLEVVLQNCSGWKISGKEIHNAEGYCKLAKIFADNSIEVINK